MTYSPSFTRKHVTILDEKTLYSGFYAMKEYSLKHQLYKGGLSEELTRECQIRSPAVCVLPYDPLRDEVVLIEQFRVGALEADSPWMLEIVAGMIEVDEDPLQVARREVKEETGLEVASLTHLYSLWVSPGGSNEVAHVYCAEVDASTAGGVHGVAAEHEDIKVLTFQRDEAIALMEAGKLPNSPAIIALQWLKMNWMCFK